MIVAFIGAIGAGKTTAAEALTNVRRINFADPLREAMTILNPIVGTDVSRTKYGLSDREPVTYNEAVELHGYRGAKDTYPEVRAIMQRLGTDLARQQWDDDFWVNQWAARADAATRNDFTVTVDDMRFLNEYQAVVGRGGLVIRINRLLDTGPDDTHTSEHYWSSFPYDYAIYNNGSIKDLHAKVREAVVCEYRKYQTAPDIQGRDI